MNYIANFYENNAGYIFAVITDENDNTLNIVEIPDGESLYELQQALKEGFVYADSYDPDNFNGLDMEEFREELETSDFVQNIAEMQSEPLAANCMTVVYPDVMGVAGHKLFQV